MSGITAARGRRVGERGAGLGIYGDFGALWNSLPLTARIIIIGAVGAAEAAVVGYVTSRNPAATPAHIAVGLRVVIILALVGTGVYALTSHVQAQMGALLIGLGLYSGLWLLNGSSNRVLFSVGVIFSALPVVLFAYLVLAYPDGHLDSRAERGLVWGVGGFLTIAWIVAYILTRQPPLKTPLLICTPHCPPNAFSFGAAVRVGEPWIALMVAAWTVIACGPPILTYRRLRCASTPLRRSLIPVLVAATASAALLLVTLILRAADVGLASAFAAAYLEAAAAAITVAILLGLSRERLFLGETLADFVNDLGASPADDPQALLATAMRDPSLTIAYRRPGDGTYVSALGEPVTALPNDRALTWIERRGLPVAAVFYDPELADQERFVQAAGSAALMRLEKAQLEADLRATVADLEASRVRLMESANLERRRLERDLHDGVQQQLTAIRIRLDMAAEKIEEDTVEGERMLSAVGKQMDGVLQELRRLARGIYPAVLGERGLVDALKSMAFSTPISVVVRGIAVGRYPEDVEVAVYFCCLEAVQNAVKHAGPDAEATVHLWQEGPRVFFEVRDSGQGFDPGAAGGGVGLTNMRDRIEAVGGRLLITSSRGQHTSVRGTVPVDAPANRVTTARSHHQDARFTR
jgi:signal transduction histidine kinase